RYTWDDIAVLDADYMSSWGACTPGLRETIDYENDDLPKLAYEMDERGDRFSVFYQLQHDQHGSPNPIRSTVHLERRSCRFGGTRAYFIAPCCGRTTLRLAVLSDGLQCGTCGSVTYRSRREHRMYRVIRKANAIAARLGCSYWMEKPTRRPLHMRQVTYEKLLRERERLVAQFSDHIYCRMLRRRCGELVALYDTVKFEK
ncbi:MAG: hypothetical protein ACR2PG_02175, partial [Hyphomicrobiaceae bacterium]